MVQGREPSVFQGTGPEGHRGRMRKRLLDNPGALADYEIIEMLLFLGVPRRDTKPLAKGLVLRFGGFREALLAQPALLMAAGVPSLAAEGFGVVADAAQKLAEAERREMVILGDRIALDRYFADATRPWRLGLSLLLLGTRNQVITEHACEKADTASVSRQVLREALRHHATAAIIVRREAGVATITGPDRDLLRQVRQGAEALSIAVHDLVVVGPDRTWRSLGSER